MTVSVLAFAHLKTVLGAETVSVSLTDGATVRDLIRHLQETCPELTQWMKSTRVAVNCEYAEPDTVLHDGDEVALIPPVSGG